MLHKTIRAVMTVAALITLASAGFATPLVIDDFTVGGFGTALLYAAGSTTGWQTQSGLSTANVLGGTRQYNLTVASNANPDSAFAYAFVTTTGSGILALNNGSGVAAFLELLYTTAPVNFAAAPGLELRHNPDLAGAVYQIVLNSAGGSSTFSHTTTSAETGHFNDLVIPWGSFSGTANLAAITSVAVNINQSSLTPALDVEIDYLRTQNMVPEPGTYALFAVGLGLLGLWRRRRS